jgi:hypothetical protein
MVPRQDSVRRRRDRNQEKKKKKQRKRRSEPVVFHAERCLNRVTTERCVERPSTRGPEVRRRSKQGRKGKE